MGLKMKKKIQFVAGIILALTGAFLMWNGSILGENTTGIAIIIGIVGIGLIATSKFRLLRNGNKITTINYIK